MVVDGGVPGARVMGGEVRRRTVVVVVAGSAVVSTTAEVVVDGVGSTTLPTLAGLRRPRSPQPTARVATNANRTSLRMNH